MITCLLLRLLSIAFLRNRIAPNSLLLFNHTMELSAQRQLYSLGFHLQSCSGYPDLHLQFPLDGRKQLRLSSLQSGLLCSAVKRSTLATLARICAPNLDWTSHISENHCPFGKILECRERRLAWARHVVACHGKESDMSLKIESGASGAIFEDVPHLTDWLPDLELYPNPLKYLPAYSAVKRYFVEDDDVVAKNIVVKLSNPWEGVYFRRSGPRDKIYFNPSEVRACIVTCGGLCPGLNTVIREIVCSLWTQYGVQDIIGIVGGYRGFYARNTIRLDPKTVNDIHKRGGTILGTSRGGHDTSKIVSSITDRGINQVYIIGGDGTQKGANVIYEELRRYGLKVAVAGIPKTIDNDIDVIDKSFGFDTAVEEAQRAINAAHTEAQSFENGVGLVKLMGRYSGYIAMYATLASRDVDCCLIPEVPFYLEGDGGLYQFIQNRLRENGHVVIVVAEGAGQEMLKQNSGLLDGGIDASGNRLLLDVGLWLCQKLKNYFSSRREVINIKYIDPTYMIRAIPSNASDNVYCTLLAHSAVHGAMAGYSGFTVGPVNARHAYIPITRVTERQRRVNTSDRMWARLLSSTNQPSFLQYQKIMHAKGKKQAPKHTESIDADLEQHIESTDSKMTDSAILETAEDNTALTELELEHEETDGNGKLYA